MCLDRPDLKAYSLPQKLHFEVMVCAIVLLDGDKGMTAFGEPTRFWRVVIWDCLVDKGVGGGKDWQYQIWWLKISFKGDSFYLCYWFYCYWRRKWNGNRIISWSSFRRYRRRWPCMVVWKVDQIIVNMVLTVKVYSLAEHWKEIWETHQYPVPLLILTYY